MSAPTHEIDKLLQDVLASASDGLTFETAKGAITDGCEAIAKMLKAMNQETYTGKDAQVLARCLAHAVKGLDEFYRLMQFAKGAPDSRPDLGADWLRGLTGAQLRQVERWVEENGAKP